MRAPRNLFVGLALAAGSLSLLELGARAFLAVVPALGDPWAGRAGVTLNAEFVRKMEKDLSNVAGRQALYVPDRRLFWRLAPGVDMEVRNEVLETRGAPVTWRIRTNELGYRGPSFAREAGGLRILTLGDSCTFGFRVDEEATYPARLRELCAKRPGRPAAVLDAGVPGYTSHQGRLQLAGLLDDVRPDVVTIAFGANDREPNGLSDADRAAWLDTPLGRLTYASGRSAVFRILSGLVPSTEFEAAARRLRVDATAFEANVDAMVEMARARGARIVLLDLAYVGRTYTAALQTLAARRDVPLVDGRATLDAAYAQIERGAAYREETEAWWRFYTEEVTSIRPVYFDQAFHERHVYATEREELQFVTLMADPIHPNAIGHHALADALVPLVCPQ